MIDTKSEISVEEQILRFAKCSEDVFEFFKYVRILDATTQSIIPFTMWKHIKAFLGLLLVNKQVILLKSKQIGISWTLAAYVLWKCYKPATNILEFSKGEDEAADLLAKSRFIHSQLPSWLQLKRGHDGATMITFPDTHSRIMALPSTEDAGVGQTATVVVRDELDFHKYAQENFAAVKPTVDAGSQIIDVSTSKRSLPTSHFKNTYRRARLGDNNYFSLFFPWHVRPDRTLEWYKVTRRDYFPEWLFEEDYPTTEEEALSTIEGEGLFDKTSLEGLLAGIKPPLEIRAGSAHIYHRPKPDIKYYVGGDAAEGKGGNYSVLWIEGEKGFTRELCAIMRSNQMTPDIFAFHANELLREYGKPYLVMGADAWGGMVLESLSALGYKDRIYCSDKTRNKLGYTESEANKQQRLLTFSLAVRDGLKVPFKPAVEEMFAFNLKDGKYISKAPYDDCVIAGSMATIAHKILPSSSKIVVRNFY